MSDTADFERFLDEHADAPMIAALSAVFDRNCADCRQMFAAQIAAQEATLVHLRVSHPARVAFVNGMYAEDLGQMTLSEITEQAT